MINKFSFLLRIIAMPFLIGLVVLMETRHSPDWFRLFTFICIFLLLVDIASLLRGRLRDALLALASLAFGLCFIETVANFFEAKQLIVSSDGWSVRQPIIGWGPEHAGRFHSQKMDPKTGATIYSADYTIDSNLLRQTQSSDTNSTVVFFGDSVTFGLGVNDAETLPQAFADAFDYKQHVLNLAFPGYGPQQFLRELETGFFDAVIGSQPKLFIFLTGPFHVERTSCKASWMLNAPRYALENGQVAFKGACYEGTSRRLREWLGNTAFYRLLFAPYDQQLNHEGVDLYIKILLAAANLGKEKYGAPTLIPYLRAPEDYLRGSGFNNDAIIERLRQNGAIVVDVSLQKEEAEGATISIKGDGHPTPFANRARAALLKNYIEQHMPGVLVSELK
jgi:hypothetical protein